MYALISRDKIQLQPGTVVRMLGSWQDYELLADSRGDSSIPRIKYRDGEILLMSPMPRHGREAHLLANMVTALLDVENRNYEAFTPITMRLPEISGIEPDYCFYIDNWQAAVGKDRIDWQVDPPPDLVIEIDVTTYSDANDYAVYQVPEVWLLKRNRLVIYELEAGIYQERSTSRHFPDVDLQNVTADCLEVAKIQGTDVAIRELRPKAAKRIAP